MILLVTEAEKRKLDEDEVTTHIQSPYGEMRIVVCDKIPPSFVVLAVKNTEVVDAVLV